MRRLLSLLLLLPALALAQSTSIIPSDSVKSACVLNATNAACVLEMKGKSTSGFVQTANTTPTGITLTPEVSLDNTNWVATSFINPNGNFEATIPNATLANGLTRGIQLIDGTRWVRVRASAWSTNSITITVTGTDTIDVDVPWSGTTASALPPMVGQVGGSVTTAAPTYTTATLNALSLDTAGNLRVAQGAGLNACRNPNATIAMVAGATSGTSSTQLVALSGSTKIYVCSMVIVGTSGTTPTFALRYGTGTACATGTTTIVGAFTTTANTLFNFVSPFAVTPAGQALCYIQTGTTPISSYSITYVQQ